MKLYLGSYKPWEPDETFSKCISMLGDKKKAAIIMNALDYSDDTLGVNNGFNEAKQVPLPAIIRCQNNILPRP